MIREIFSSIQGEGIYLGKRQIFVRFSLCNLDCSYCDTPHTTDPEFCIVEGKMKKIVNADDVFYEIKNLFTRDLHSISLTGGEPLLYAEFIKDLAAKINFPLYLETNSTLPEKAKEIRDLIKYVAADIKTEYPEFYEKSLQTIRILKDKEIFIKIVITKKTKATDIEKIAIDIEKIKQMPLILQPSSNEKWDKKFLDLLLKMSEKSSAYLNDVRIIPQIHKFVGFR